MATAEREIQDIQADGEAPEPAPDNEPSTLEAQLAAVRAELEEATRKLTAEAENRDRLRKSREKVKRLEGRMLEAKEAASFAKKAFETAMSEHLELEDELDSGQGRLAFGDEAGGVAEATDDADETSWRSVRLDSLIGADGDPLPDGILRALVENDPPLETMGAVADWSKGGKYLTDVKGIGDAKAADIDAVFEHFWNQRAVDDPVNADVLAGVKEAESAPVPPPWRSVVIGELGLAEATVELLDEHVIPTVGELVALLRNPPGWLDDATLLDIDAGLTRFRHRRSNAEIEDFDVAMGWDTEEPKSKAKRARKAKAS